MATAEAIGPVLPQHYLWWFPGSPVKVHLNLRVVQRLSHLLSVSGASGFEEGLLFGGIRDGFTEVLDFQPATKISVPSMVGGLSVENKRSLVGYYRTGTGEAFQLSAQDLSLAREVFAKPYSVFLIIHHHGFGPPTATFFFHDRDGRMADFAFLEFPFDPSLLAAEQFDRTQRSQQAIELPDGLPPAPVSPVTPEDHRPKSRLVPKTAAWVCFLALVFATGMLWLNNSAFRERCSSLWRAISTLPSKTGSSVSAVRPAAHPSIALRATRQNGDVELSWNRDSPLIAVATSGALSIQDGQSTRVIPFDAAQLRGGNVLYAPRTDQIFMQLTVTTPGETFTESATVILPGIGEPQVYPVAAPTVFVPMAVSPAPPSSPAPVTPPKKFTPPLLKGDSSRGAVVLQDPPALADRPATTLGTVPNIVKQPASAPPLPPAAATAETPRPSPSRVDVYDPPVAVTKTQPKFPPELRNLIVKQTTVQVKVAINKDGRVVKAEAIPQKNVSLYLVNAAVDAARSWKFKPAMSNQEPVSSEATLQFVFNR